MKGSWAESSWSMLGAVEHTGSLIVLNIPNLLPSSIQPWPLSFCTLPVPPGEHRQAGVMRKEFFQVMFMQENTSRLKVFKFFY